MDWGDEDFVKGASRCWGDRHVWGAPECDWREDVDERTSIDKDMDWGDEDFVVAQISCGYYFTCALSTAGEVRCVGPSWHGQLGRDEPNRGYTDCGDIIGADTVGADAIKAIDFGLEKRDENDIN